MRGLVAGELAEKVVDFAGLDVLGKPGHEERSDLVVRCRSKERRRVGPIRRLLLVRGVRLGQVVLYGWRRRLRRRLVVWVVRHRRRWVVCGHVVHRSRIGPEIRALEFALSSLSVPLVASFTSSLVMAMGTFYRLKREYEVLGLEIKIGPNCLSI